TRYSRFGKDNSQWSSAPKASRCLGSRIYACNITLISCLVQQADIAIHIACNKQRQVLYLQGVAVQRRHAFFIQLNAQSVQSKIINIGLAANSDQYTIDADIYCASLNAHPAFGSA